MAFTSKQINQLAAIVSSANELLKEAMSSLGHEVESSPTRKRRTGRELVQFKKTIKAGRRQGATAAVLAKKYGVSVNYIYQL